MTAEPTRTWLCDNCGELIERYRGDGDLQCDCGAWYNSFGQRLRDDWQGNRSNWDDDVSDLDGFEEQQLLNEALGAPDDHCPACGDRIDSCQGHGSVGDPTGYAILQQHDEDDHSSCNPSGCEEANNG